MQATIAVFGVLRFPPDRLADVRPHLRRLVEETVRLDGCIAYGAAHRPVGEAARACGLSDRRFTAYEILRCMNCGVRRGRARSSVAAVGRRGGCVFVSVLAAHAAEPLVVAYWEGFWPPPDVELVVYDDGTVIGSNHEHCSTRRTAWPTDFLVGKLAPKAVDALTDSLERALAGHDDEVVGGTSNCIDGRCSERLVLLTFVDGARRRFVCGTGCKAPWFLEARTALGEAQAVARAPYRAPEVALRVMPVSDSLWRTKDVPTLDLGWVACDGAWCATRPRAWYDTSFPEPCGRWSSEMMRMTSRHWCGLVRVGGALGTLYATDLLPGHERWGE